MVINHEKVKFFLIAVLLIVYCRKQHTTGLDTHHCSRWKVCDCNQSLSNQFFRLIISVNTGKDSSVCACSIIQCELKKLLRLWNGLTCLNLNCSEVTLAKSIEIYCILKERLYSYIAEIDLVVRSEEAVIVVCLLILMYLSVILTIALECRDLYLKNFMLIYRKLTARIFGYLRFCNRFYQFGICFYLSTGICCNFVADWIFCYTTS